jgi:hypothetical protein
MAASLGLNTPQDPGLIDSNALNVTRVGGFAAFISAILAGIAQFFPVSATDPVALRVAVPAIEGFIVAAALFTAAIIIAADLRARSTVHASPNPASATPPANAAPNGGGGGGAQAQPQTAPRPATTPSQAGQDPGTAAPTPVADPAQEYRTRMTELAAEFDSLVGDPPSSDPTVYTALQGALEQLTAPDGALIRHQRAQSVAAEVADEMTLIDGIQDDAAKAAHLGDAEQRVVDLRSQLLGLANFRPA